MKRYSRALILLFLGGMTLLALIKIGNIDISWETLRRIDGKFLLLGAVIHYSGFAMRGWRWKKLLAGMGHRVSFRYAFSLLVSGWFASALLPARLGDVLRATMLRRDHQTPLAEGFGSIATERGLDIVLILAFALISAFWALAGNAPAWVWQTVGGGSVAVFGVMAVLIAVPQLEGFFAGLLPWTLYRKAVTFGFDLLASIRRLGENPRLLLAVFAQTGYIWLCDIFLMYFALLSAGVIAPVSVAAFSSMAVDLAASVPIIPGALGQVEGTALAVFSLFHILPEQSGLVILLNRFVSYWTFILFSGAVAYFFGFSEAMKNSELRVMNDE